MAKQVLKIDAFSSEDFILIGIVCQYKDYRLCHYLNHVLDIHLKRENDYEIIQAKRKQKLVFSFYKAEKNEGEKYYLFANKTIGGMLIPEQKSMDYFLMIKEYENLVNEEAVLASVKSIPAVLGAYITDFTTLRSRENLIF